jgi:hypothetical protein
MMGLTPQTPEVTWLKPCSKFVAAVAVGLICGVNMMFSKKFMTVRWAVGLDLYRGQWAAQA